MIQRHSQLFALSLLLVSLVACSQLAVPEKSPPADEPSPVAVPSASTSPEAADGDLTVLFSRIWQVTTAPSAPAVGSIYIFLPNGTLLETSCVEPYRIATWTIDKERPQVLRVVEDGQLAFTATIAELTNTTLRLQQNLVNSNELRNITLTAVEQEFVCPDLPKGP